VRELENAIEYAVATCQRQTVQIDDLPPELVAAAEGIAGIAGTAGKAGDLAAEEPAADDDVARLRAVLDKHHWHHARAAVELGISRTTLWRKLRALGLS
jgi:transcriptional regulator of acetoin/glycerol metabolism